MRSDFNKILVERERIRHADHYHNYRHMKGPKGLDDEEVGGREGMRKRFNFGYDRKQFNENLNPLWGWLRSCVGKKWDKCYSELCRTFDMRGVINAHILQHLYQKLETDTFLDEKGRVMTVSGGYSGSGAIPIKESYKDYYVCPKDGTVKKTNKPPRRSVIKQREAEKKAKELAVKRVLNDKEVLHLIDGVWYHFDLLPVPDARVVYDRPRSPETFRIGYHFGKGPDNRLEKTWDELNQMERERFGVRRVVGGTAYDEFTGHTVYRDQKGVIRLNDNVFFRRAMPADVYHANKKTASKKHLKQAGLL